MLWEALLALSKLTDVGILTENTTQIAAGEKNSAAASASDKATLLAEMCTGGADVGVTAGLAESNLPGQPIRPTGPRAEGTRPEHFYGLFYPLSKFSRSSQTFVSGGKR